MTTKYDSNSIIFFSSAQTRIMKSEKCKEDFAKAIIRNSSVLENLYTTYIISEFEYERFGMLAATLSRFQDIALPLMKEHTKVAGRRYQTLNRLPDVLPPPAISISPRHHHLVRLVWVTLSRRARRETMRYRLLNALQSALSLIPESGRCYL